MAPLASANQFLLGFNVPPIGGIPRAPAPAAKPVAASTSTGNNPRGVAIKAPPATVPVALRTGANPRGVAIITPKTITPPTPRAAPKAAPIPVHGAFGGGPSVATVLASRLPASIRNAPGVASGIIARLGNEVIHLPETTVEGAIGLGKAELHDVLHGTLPYPGNPNIGQSQLLHMGEGAITSDPVYQAITHGSLKPLGQNPLGTLLDATAAYGLVGNAAGAVARVGWLGDNARAAASMARTPAYIPGMGRARTSRRTRSRTRSRRSRAVARRTSSPA